MKRGELFKSIAVAVMVPLIFFFILEGIQRVRWYLKSGGSAYWLLYGFVKKPKDYDLQIARIAAAKSSAKPQTVGSGVYEIPIWEKTFPNGIKKHNPDFPEYKGIVNSLGFRSGEFSPDKEPGTYRIISTGGSTTAGYESDVGHTYPALLQKKLNGASEGRNKFEVINAGIGEEELPYINKLLKNELVGYRPDMVTLYLTFNHLHMWRGSVNVPKDLYYRMYKLKEWFSSRSLLFLTLREKLNIALGRTLGDVYIPIKGAAALSRAYMNTPGVFTSYRQDLEEFIRICKENGAAPVLMTEACVCNSSYMILGKEMKVVYEKMYGVMEDVARRNGAVFIDTAREMEGIKHMESLFTDGIHLKPEGNEVLAGIIYRNLKKRIEPDGEEGKN
jgi:lysophospholipase L1-like esterase